MAASDVGALLIHAVYLLNCASEDPEIRAKSLASLTSSLRAGAALGAHAVVLHPGLGADGRGRRRRSRAPARSSPRRSRSPRAARCTSRTPPAPAARSGARSTSSRRSIEAAGGDERLGLCLDSCHLLASGYRHPHRGGPGRRARRVRACVGLERLGSLHLNDSQTPLGSNATATRTSARASSAHAAARCSCPSRASRACRACSRPRAEPRPGARRSLRALRSAMRALAASGRASDRLPGTRRAGPQEPTTCRAAASRLQWIVMLACRDRARRGRAAERSPSPAGIACSAPSSSASVGSSRR